MRQKLNENPLAQAIAIGALAVLVGFLLLIRASGGGTGSSGESPQSADAPAVATSPSPTAPAVAGEPAPAVAPAAAPPVGANGFEPSPGLPKAVADAYADGKVVVLLVVREHPQGCYSGLAGGRCAGLDDRKLEAIVRRLNGQVALFVTHARGISRYSRIAQGVEVDRVPALIVVRPQRLTDGPLPEASVSYGFRGPGSVEQAVRDALYEGRDDLPYYPQ